MGLEKNVLTNIKITHTLTYSHCRHQKLQFLLVQEMTLTKTLGDADYLTAGIWLALTSSRKLTLKIHIGTSQQQGEEIRGKG